MSTPTINPPPSDLWTASGPPPIQPAPSWIQRNWKRLVVLLMVLFFAAILAFVAGILGLVMWSFHQSDVYKLAIDKARKNPEVVAKLGSPIEAGLLFSGSMNVSGDTGSADMTIPIHGPKGKADLYLNARKAMGEWTFQYLVVKTAAGEKIQLAGEPGKQLEEPSKPAAPQEF